MAIDWERARWRKSSHSDTGGCVEVANVGGVIGVRDTKATGSGPILEFSEAEWSAFLAGVAGGEFSVEALRR
jgi:hypothetical protein